MLPFTLPAGTRTHLRGRARARVCVPAFGVHLCPPCIKWFRISRLAAVYPTNDTVRHVRLRIYIHIYVYICMCMRTSMSVFARARARSCVYGCCTCGHPREKGGETVTRKLSHARQLSCPNYLPDGSLYHLDRDGASMRACPYPCVHGNPITR